MRPNFTKTKPEPALDAEDSSEEVAETQSHGGTVNEQDSDSDEPDYASDASHTPKKRMVQTKEKRMKEKEAKEESKEGPVKTAARKIKATAHANYRRLKIKGKGATGGKGKFGRRR